MFSKPIKGFTLVELLIVIAILAVLLSAVVIVLNPSEFLAQARDSKRIGELDNLSKAVTLYSNSVVGGYKGEADTVYISIPDTSPTCDNLLSSLPDLSIGWSYHCVLESDLQKTDGAGWLPINLKALPGGSPFEQLPIDPENNATANLYFAYIYGNTGYVLATTFESEHRAGEAEKDGGNDPNRFETGSDLSLWAKALGL
ncbi:MAG: prepilin-type N-terminal cleavage/methylation domain-containing protein [Parcubacteria group bacterium]